MAKRRSGKSRKSGKSNWQRLNEKRRLERQVARSEAFAKCGKMRICGKRNPVALEIQALRRFRKELPVVKAETDLEETEKKVDVKKIPVAVMPPGANKLRWTFGFRCIQHKNTEHEDERVLVPPPWAPPLLFDDDEAEFR